MCTYTFYSVDERLWPAWPMADNILAIGKKLSTMLFSIGGVKVLV